MPVAGPRIFKMGIFEEPITRNFWNYYGGPGGSVWTQYALDGVATSLYTYSDQRFDWVPLLADGFPSAIVKEEVGGDEFWTTSVSFRAGVTWSDGVEITAADFAFVVRTVLDFELASNWATAVDSAFVDHVKVVDTHTAKIYFKGTDAEGNPQTPGLGVWQFGLALAPILAKHCWEPIVDAAMSTGEDAATRQAALFAHVPDGEPTAGGFVFGQSEPEPSWKTAQTPTGSGAVRG